MAKSEERGVAESDTIENIHAADVFLGPSLVNALPDAMSCCPRISSLL